MAATVEKKHFWQQPIGSAGLWPAPLVLALMGHLAAWPKFMLQGNFLLMNAQTERVLRLWWFVSEHTLWLFVGYASVLVAVFLILRVLRSAGWIIAIVFVLLALPGFWYFMEMSYLWGKLITLER